MCAIPQPTQISTTVVYFTDTLWPEFSIWHLLSGIFYYQTQHDRIRAARQLIAAQAATDAPAQCALAAGRRDAFLRRFDERETERLRALCGEAA